MSTHMSTHINSQDQTVLNVAIETDGFRVQGLEWHDELIEDQTGVDVAIDTHVEAHGPNELAYF